METIKHIFKIGYGPSSSHTMGPYKAAEIFKERNKKAAGYRVTLYGSLALTGKGHLTDVALYNAMLPSKCEIIWEPETILPFHTNGMKFEALNSEDIVIDEWVVYSVGGGDIVCEEQSALQEDLHHEEIYDMTELSEILAWCNKTGKTYWEYVLEIEDSDIMDYLNEVWKTMRDAISRGLEAEGVLPGTIGLQRKACSYYTKAKGYKDSLKNRGLLFAYALATAEENAGGGLVVTAPTCGSAGVLPAVLYYIQERHDFTNKRILRALATAGLIGNIIKKNASISAAEVGCQGEIGRCLCDGISCG